MNTWVFCKILGITYCYSFIFCVKILVHCRIGSLEVLTGGTGQGKSVHCRIGSLEELCWRSKSGSHVHCRIGSLEEIVFDADQDDSVHCRIGSLEGHHP